MQKLLGLPSAVLRRTAYLLLLALSVTTLGPVLHGVHDTDCDPVVIVHDESQHQFAAPSSNAGAARGGDHCVACHFLRTSRGPVSWEPSGLHVLTSGTLLFHSDGQLVAAPSASPTPARAPPTV
jgi:hypothetical protein